MKYKCQYRSCENCDEIRKRMSLFRKRRVEFFKGVLPAFQMCRDADLRKAIESEISISEVGSSIMGLMCLCESAEYERWHDDETTLNHVERIAQRQLNDLIQKYGYKR